MTRHQLRFCHANVLSLAANGRLFDVELLAAAHGIDVLCLTETWLQSSKHSSTSFSIPRYQPPFRFDRPAGHGGGVAIYIREHLTAHRIMLNSCSIE